MAHLKAINDPGCEHVKVTYMDYMAQHYTHRTANRLHQGLHDMPDDFANDVLKKYCAAMINLFHGRPFARDYLATAAAAANDFLSTWHC